MPPRKNAKAKPKKRDAGARAEGTRASSANHADDEGRANVGRVTRAQKKNERHADALPGLPVSVVVGHVLSEENLPKTDDLARLRAVSHGMRDAVAQTGRKVEPRELLDWLSVGDGDDGSDKTLPDVKLFDGDDPFEVAEAYCAKHGLDFNPCNAKNIAEFFVKRAQEKVECVNGWYPVEPDDPATFNPVRDAETAEASLEAFRTRFRVEIKKVRWCGEEVFLYKGQTGGMNGSPYFFCGKCAGIWMSHEYRPKPRLVRRSCKFCRARTFQEEVLYSTGAG